MLVITEILRGVVGLRVEGEFEVKGLVGVEGGVLFIMGEFNFTADD